MDGDGPPVAETKGSSGIKLVLKLGSTDAAPTPSQVAAVASARPSDVSEEELRQARKRRRKKKKKKKLKRLQREQEAAAAAAAAASAPTAASPPISQNGSHEVTSTGSSLKIKIPMTLVRTEILDQSDGAGAGSKRKAEGTGGDAPKKRKIVIKSSSDGDNVTPLVGTWESTTPVKQKAKGRAKKGKKSASRTKSKASVFGRPMPLYKAVSGVIKRLIDADKSMIFYSPVTDEIAPGYSKVIKRPMCFLTMREKWKERKYDSIAAALRDVHLIFDNTMTYNNDQSFVYAEAQRLRDVIPSILDYYLPKVQPQFHGPVEETKSRLGTSDFDVDVIMEEAPAAEPAGDATDTKTDIRSSGVSLVTTNDPTGTVVVTEAPSTPAELPPAVAAEAAVSEDEQDAEELLSSQQRQKLTFEKNNAKLQQQQQALQQMQQQFQQKQATAPIPPAEVSRQYVQLSAAEISKYRLAVVTTSRDPGRYSMVHLSDSGGVVQNFTAPQLFHTAAPIPSVEGILGEEERDDSLAKAAKALPEQLQEFFSAFQPGKATAEAMKKNSALYRKLVKEGVAGGASALHAKRMEERAHLQEGIRMVAAEDIGDDFTQEELSSLATLSKDAKGIDLDFLPGVMEASAVGQRLAKSATELCNLASRTGKGDVHAPTQAERLAALNARMELAAIAAEASPATVAAKEDVARTRHAIERQLELTFRGKPLAGNMGIFFKCPSAHGTTGLKKS